MADNQKQTVQWFPGHMAKTRRMITENIKNVDAYTLREERKQVKC